MKGARAKVMAVDGGNAGVSRHLDDGEQVARIASALRDLGRAGVAEVEESPILNFALSPEITFVIGGYPR